AFVCAPRADIAGDMGNELQAASAVAANLGLGRVEPVVVSRSKHTSIRLDPLPIIARVQSASSGDSAYESAAREVAIASGLASLGAPTVRPVGDFAPGPHVQDGCVMTLWDAVRHRPIKRGERVLA